MSNRTYKGSPPQRNPPLARSNNSFQDKSRPQHAVLLTRHLELEPILESHADKLFEGLRQCEAYVYIPDDPPSSLGTLKERYQKLSRRVSPDGLEAWLNWAIRIKNGTTYGGYVQATVKLADNNALIAYHVIPSYWHQGIGKEAVAGMLLFLFKEYEITHIEAHIDTRNIASIALMRSLGFTLFRHIDHADSFKGHVSHEDHYLLRRQDWRPHFTIRD